MRRRGTYASGGRFIGPDISMLFYVVLVSSGLSSGLLLEPLGDHPGAPSRL